MPDGLDPVDYIIGANLERRHMTVGQQAMARALALEAQGRRGDGRWTRNAVNNNLLNTAKMSWRNAMTAAGTVIDATRRWPEEAGDLPRQVMQGETPFAIAVEQVKVLEAVAAEVDVLPVPL
jgi:hypothetical protein